MKATQRIRNERGATIVFVAVSLAMMLGIGALAVDLGMLIKARNDAQRAADAAALAGASAFRDLPPATAQTVAHDRAMDYASRNYVLTGQIDTLSEVTVQVLPDSEKVRVWVEREGIGLWFARTLGIELGTVNAKAAARAVNAGVGKCIKPFAIPDLWDETNTAPPARNGTGEDVNDNDVWDSGEGWQFDPSSGDRYGQFGDDNVAPDQQTGYGSDWRNGDGIYRDYGRTITIKAQSPKEDITSGFFYPWRIGESSGAADYRENILGCNSEPVELGTPYDVENGNMVGPTKQAIEDLIAMDPNARWDPTAGPAHPETSAPMGGITGSNAPGDWRNSPRVVPLGIFSPDQIAAIQGGGSLNISFNTFAMFFIEGFDGNGNQAPLKGRFLYFAPGSAGGPVAGPLIKNLVLVE